VNKAPIVRDVFLVGGGHSHVLLMRRWAMKPMPGVRLTLISTDAHTPYSGMLPGLVAGHYSVDDIHVDLRTLSTWAGIRFIEESVTAINLDRKEVSFNERPAMAFDVLSLDTGSTPDLSVLGAAEHSTPVKPVYNFFNRWCDIASRLQQQNAQSVSIGVVGSGAGGFELITAMRHALPKDVAECHWFLRGEFPLAGRPRKVGELALQSAEEQGIIVNRNVDVVEVKEGSLISADDREFQVDEILWCTAAVGPHWARRAGFQLDKRGFVATNKHLQSISHPFVFATGDIGTQVDTPSLKAGVFAVRQAPVLYENIRRHLMNQPLKTYRPQNDFLSLMATGGKRAIASRGPMVIEADWVWRWKDHIDQTFMKQFKVLPSMPDTKAEAVPAELLVDSDQPEREIKEMQCKGCGAKVAGSVLDRVLKSLPITTSVDIESGVAQADDAAVVNFSGNKLVQSVDHINAIVDDPYLLGRIAALHAMSDVFTCNASAETAQVLLSIVESSDDIAERDLRQVMHGIVDALNQESCVLIGGHTTQSTELSVGLVVNGMMSASAEKDARFINIPSSIGEGDAIVLTQALGTGVLFAGLMQQKTHGRDIRFALEQMQVSNGGAADLLREHGVSKLTDVTGFGLLGHIERLLVNEAATLGAGALEVSNGGVRSSLWASNRASLNRFAYDSTMENDALPLLCDPQTSGGVCAVVPASKATHLIAKLHAAGYLDATIIGSVNKSGGYTIS